MLGKMKTNMSKIKSIIIKTIPTSIPSTTSFVSILRMYNIPKNPVTIMMANGMIMLTLGRLSVNIGLNTDEKIVISTHITIPYIIASLTFIF